MRKQLARTILAAGTVAAALCLSIPTAMAAGTWTVTGGPAFTSSQSAGASFTLKDVTKSLTFTCSTATGKGTVTDQSMSTNTNIGSITGSTFGDSTHQCAGPLGSKGTDSQTPGTTAATLVAGSFASPVTTGTITGIDHTLTITSPVSCTARVKGTAGVTYNNMTDVLAFTTAGDSLKITATTCFFLGVNDVVTFASTGGETVTGSVQVKQP